MKRFHLISMLTTLLLVSLAAPPAHAWKPKTHIHLANEALKGFGIDVAEGKRTDKNYPIRLRVHRDRMRLNGNKKILNAIRAYPNYYFAGVLGPDAYPDIVTGQTVVHPMVALPLKHNTGGTNRWLTHLWNKAEARGNSKTDRMFRAFVAGYITHAIGDLFAHAMVNAYTGGPFHVGKNMLRHNALEGYIGFKTPDLKQGPFKPRALSLTNSLFDALISLEPNIARDLFRTGKKDKAGNAEGKYSFVKSFWRLRQRLITIRGQLQNAKKVGKGLNAVPPIVRMLPPPMLVTYLTRWIAQINSGLRAWIRLNHLIAQGYVYAHPGITPPSTKKIEKAVNEYREEYLKGMLGDPRYIEGLPTNALRALKKRVKSKLRRNALFLVRTLVPKEVRDAFLNALKQPLAGLCKALGQPCEIIRELRSQSRLWRDAIKSAAKVRGFYENTQCKLTLKAIDENILRLEKATDKHFDWRRVAAASNTVKMTQLMLLNRSDALKLLKKAGINPSEQQWKRFKNMMLGFLKSIDDPSKRSTEPTHARLLNENQFFTKVFYSQEGWGEDGKIFNKPRKCTVTQTRPVNLRRSNTRTAPARRSK